VRDISQRAAVLHVVLQSERHGDCAIATLASYLGRTYEEVLFAAARVSRGDVLERGLHTTEMVRIAKRLGTKLRELQWERVDVDEATGILTVNARIHDQTYALHTVLFRHGDIIDCRDGTVWDSDIYMKHFAADPVSLLVEA
jgi:ABC-type bacteriocin/lantibiotic exporter with double-glycine peptidase domain